MGAPPGVLLDLDGTIADSIDFFCGLTCEVLAEAGIVAPERARLVEAIALGIPPPTLFLPQDFPDREAFLVRTYESRWSEWVRRYGAEIEPIPGACEAVETLHRRGTRIGLVTSSSGDLPFLERWGIRRCFDAIVNRDQVKQIKPHPEPLLSALEQLGIEAGGTWSVGDTPIDARAGRAAGLRVVGVLTGAGTEAQLRDEGVTDILPSIAELPDFLERTATGPS